MNMKQRWYIRFRFPTEELRDELEKEIAPIAQAFQERHDLTLEIERTVCRRDVLK